MIDIDNFMNLYTNIIANYNLFFEPKETKVVSISSIAKVMRVVTESYMDLCSVGFREENNRLKDACGRYMLYISGYSESLTRNEVKKSIGKFEFFCAEKNIKMEKNFRARFIKACLYEFSENGAVKNAGHLAEIYKIIQNTSEGSGVIW